MPLCYSAPSHSVAHGMIRSISASKRRIDPSNCCISPRKNPATALDIQAMAFVLPSGELLTIQNCASLTDKLIPGLTLPTTTGDCGKAQPSSEPDDHISLEMPPLDLASLRLSREFVCLFQFAISFSQSNRALALTFPLQTTIQSTPLARTISPTSRCPTSLESQPRQNK